VAVVAVAATAALGMTAPAVARTPADLQGLAPMSACMTAHQAWGLGKGGPECSRRRTGPPSYLSVGDPRAETPARLRDGLLVVDRRFLTTHHSPVVDEVIGPRQPDLVFTCSLARSRVLAASIGDVEDEACGRCRPLPFSSMRHLTSERWLAATMFLGVVVLLTGCSAKLSDHIANDMNATIFYVCATHTQFHALDWGDIEFQDPSWWARTTSIRPPPSKRNLGEARTECSGSRLSPMNLCILGNT